MLTASEAANLVYGRLPVPICLVDAAGRLEAVNSCVEIRWGVTSAGVAGLPFFSALGVVPVSAGPTDWLEGRGGFSQMRMACLLCLPDGSEEPVTMIATPVGTPERPLTAIFLIDSRTAPLLANLPAWALADPLTGLGNRQRLERELPDWQTRAGAVAVFDLDNLKEANDRHGHATGDGLLGVVGKVLAQEAPPASLAVRSGGDEFVVLIAGEDAAAAETWAGRVTEAVAAHAAAAKLPLAPRLSYGTADFGVGGVSKALQHADTALYECKGIVLRARGGGSLVLTHRGRQGVMRPQRLADTPATGAFAARFDREFDRCFRIHYAVAAERARQFVAFVDPPPASAVVEVGAGSGRITFDGGLADRIGADGQLLVTDPSEPQLAVARSRAFEGGYSWVRFVAAPAEALPLEAATADVALGALFIHFTDGRATLRELARVVRPGGMVAISSCTAFSWPPLWDEALEPVWAALREHRLPRRHYFPQPGQVAVWMKDAGLNVECEEVSGPDTWAPPSPEEAVRTWHQMGLVRLLLRGVPPAQHQRLEDAFEQRLAAGMARRPPADWEIHARVEQVRARRPLV